MLAPIALVLIGYSYLFLMPQQDQLKEMQRRFDALSESQHATEHGLMDTMTSMSKAKKDLRDVDAELNELQAVEADLVRLRQSMVSELTQASLPAATMQRVTTLFERHQLRVLESGPESGSSERAERVLQPVVKLLVEKTTRPNVSRDKLADGREVYQVRLQGRFQDLSDALEELALRQDQVLPLSLQMEPMELDSVSVRQKARIWTLVLLV